MKKISRRDFLRGSAAGAASFAMSMSVGAVSQADDSEKVVTLTMWNTEVLSSGEQKTEIAQYIEEKLGIRMNIVQGDSQKFSLLTAGGDLPDIIYSNPAQQNVSAEQLISSGQLIALDDLIEEYGQNIKENFPMRLEYSREYGSNGEGVVYFIPIKAYESDPENPSISYTISNVGLMTRWDIYKAIGAPEINSTDDYLEALKEMQEYATENDLADGSRIYAISGWSDWGSWPWYVSSEQEMGYVGIQYGVLNIHTGEVERLYESDAYWDSIYFYYKAYNMGILDPEAFTMTSDQFWEKCYNGQVLMAYASWQTNYINQHYATNGHPEWGYEKLPCDGFGYVIGVTAQDEPIGNGMDYANAITTNCKNPEKAMELLNFLNSEEGARLIYSGVEGVHWSNEDGIVQPTEEYLTQSKEDSNYKDDVGINIYNKFCGFQNWQVLADGYPADLAESDEQKAETCLDIDLDYCEYFSELDGEEYLYPGQVLYHRLQNGEISTVTTELLLATFAPAASDDTTTIISQCDQYMNVQVAKAIMASSDEEFEAIREECMQGLSDKGYDDTIDELQEIWEETKAIAAGFGIEYEG